MNITPSTACVDPHPRPVVYVVAWDQAEIVKVGYTAGTRRWKMFRRDARLIGIEAFGASSAALRREHELHADLASFCPRAFTGRTEAIPFLGGRGAGWTECFRITAFPVEMMLKYAPAPNQVTP